MCFYLYLYIAEAKTFSTMWSESGDSGHPCLIPDLIGKAFRFSPLSIMLAMCCHVWPSV